MLVTVEHERAGEDAGDPLGHVDGILLAGDVLEQDAELVAAEPRHGVGGAHRLLEARSRRGEQLIAGAVAQALVDELEAVQVEGQHGGQRVPAATLALGGLLETVQEEQPVGKAGERVVQRAVADAVIGGLALHDVAQHVGQRLHEVHVARLEVAGPHRVEPERAERVPAPLDHHGQATARAPAGQHPRALEPPLGLPVGDHRRLAGEQRVSRLRAQAGGHAIVERDAGQALDRAEGDRVLGGDELHHRADVQAEQRDADPDGLLHEVGEAGALQRVLPEACDRGLLVGAPLELGPGVLLLGDVGHHAMPAFDPVGPLHHQRVVADPDVMPVAVQQPVLDRAGQGGGAAVELILLGDHAPGVVGMQPACPHTGVGAPLLRGEAEDLRDLGADVVPAAIAAGVGRVQDRRNPLQEAGVIRVRGLAGAGPGPGLRRRVPAVRSAVRHVWGRDRQRRCRPELVLTTERRW